MGLGSRVEGLGFRVLSRLSRPFAFLGPRARGRQAGRQRPDATELEAWGLGF